MVYLDNAATSWPKPPQVAKAMAEYMEQMGSPGRSGHRIGIGASRTIYDTRELTAELFNVKDPFRVIFTLNATYAINLALKGILKPGDRVVTTGIEHNAVMRPLRALEKQGVEIVVVSCDTDGSLPLEQMAEAVTSETRLVTINHASNITGTITPVEDISGIAHKAGALFMVDAAQTGGVLPIDMQALGIDLLAFTGHKGLLGPQGTGGLIMGDRVDTSNLEPLVRGGTGSRSEYDEQPEDLPDKYESGTPNGVGLAGLGAGIRVVMEQGIEAIRAHEMELTGMLLEGLAGIKGVKVYGPVNPERSTAVVSFTIDEKRVSEVGMRLDREYDVMCRVGLHCAPAAHKTIGTFPEGTVRFAPGFSTTSDDIRTAIDAVEHIAKS